MKKVLVFLLGIGASTHVWGQQTANYNTAPAPGVEQSQPSATATSGETSQTASNRPPVSLRVVGSNLMNPQGQYLGRIEEVMLNAANQIEFALVETSFPTDNMMVTPVPWSMLSYVWDQSRAGGTPGAVQTFIAPLDKAKLDQAPKISRTSRTNLDPGWEQRVLAFYGSTPGAIGATGTGSSSVAGGGAGGAATAVPTAGGTGVGAGATTGVGTGNVGPVDGFPGYVVGVGGGLVTNTVTTNVPVTSNFVTITNVIGTNRFVSRTNLFRGDTNFAGAGTNVQPRSGLLPGGTNLIYGRRQFPNSGSEPPRNIIGNSGNTGGTGSGTGTTRGSGGAFAPIPPVNPNTGATTTPTTILPPSNVAPPGTIVPPGDANPPGTVVPTVPGGNTGIFTPGTPTTPGTPSNGTSSGSGTTGTTGTGTATGSSGTGTGGTGAAGGTTGSGTASGGTSAGGTVGGTAAGAGSSGR